jgi:hypothetical protein
VLGTEKVWNAAWLAGTSGARPRHLLLFLLAFVVWNAAFDFQVRQAGDRFVAEQLERVSRNQPVTLIAVGFQPAVRRAALSSTLAAGLALGAAALLSRARAPR